LDSKELNEIRARNSARLKPMLDQVRAGSDCQLLIPYAKAYLGLFLNIDNSLTPDERLASFVDEALLPDIYQGFEASLQHNAYPQADDFSIDGNDELRERCWIILATIERGLASDGNTYLESLPLAIRKAAICFVMTLEQGERPQWPVYYAQHFQQELEQALIESWTGEPAARSDYLSGMDWYFNHVDTPDPELIYWLASHWRRANYRGFYHLLSLAVEHGEPARLSELVEQALHQDFTIRIRMLWCGTGLVSDPEHYANRMQMLCGFNKEKIVPLLDFCVTALGYIDDPLRRGRISAALIRIAGPKFPPFDDSDPIVAKLQYLLVVLSQCPPNERQQLIEELLKVRVLRAYKPALQAIVDSA